MKHAIITQSYKCLLHAKFGNQPYPDDINVYYVLGFGNQIIINDNQLLFVQGKA